jgi:hypothetical protein
MFGQLRPELFAQVGHGIERMRMFLPDPFMYLFRPEFLGANLNKVRL